LFFVLFIYVNIQSIWTIIKIIVSNLFLFQRKKHTKEKIRRTCWIQDPNPRKEWTKRKGLLLREEEEEEEEGEEGKKRRRKKRKELE